MDVNSIYEFTLFCSNKLQSGAISGDEFNSALKAVNIDLFKQRIGLPEEYQVGNPQPTQAFQLTQKMTDDLRKFIVKEKLTTDNDGYFPVPDNYAAFSSMRFIYTESKGANCKKPATNKREVILTEPVTDAELSIRLNNAILKPTYQYPILAFYSYGIKVYPDDISVAELTYLRLPVTPVWGYTIVDDQPVYDAATTVNTEFPETMLVDFSSRIMKYIGINIREEMLYQWAAERQFKGQ